MKLKKVLVSILVGVLLILTVVSPARAQTQPATGTPATGPWYNQNFGQWSAKVFDEHNTNEIFGERYTYAQVNWILNSITSLVIGSDITNCLGQYTTGNLGGVGDCLKKSSVSPVSSPSTPGKPSPTQNLVPTSPTMGNSGAIGTLAFLTNSLMNFRPASGVEYIRTTAGHIFPQAYAQTGVGYNTLSPVQVVWGVVRNISYSLMIVVIIAMAFLIMFRVKISPQVVVTVQSALPRIAIALILITFSYAIAGLLVDLMYVVVGGFAVMLKLGGDVIVANPTSVALGSKIGPTGVNGLDTIGLFNQLVSGNGLWSIVVGILLFTVLLAIGGIIIGAVGAATIIGLPVGVIGGLILLVGAVFLLFILFRLFWLMAKTACITVLLIIGGPIMILVGTFSNSMSFLGWIRMVAANLAVYPTVIVMLFFSHYFFWGWFAWGLAQAFPYLNTFGINWTTTKPGVVNLPGMPIGTNVIGLIIAFVIISLIPKAAEVIQGIITGKGVNVGGAVGEAVGAPFGLGSGAYNAYRAPVAGQFKAQLDEALKGGQAAYDVRNGPGAYKELMKRYQTSQAGETMRGLLGKLVK